ncbi:mitotic spindle checkpoint protein Dma1 [Schizosaccharomyces cryophilus OY26]|uniref:Mitotic spindle checkpoint protein Dma1 n=1 Tax=Schizosaccharomyces cryophilus (strain OY26 / ATCC MYA-4695 / CBS 11777 / NBRC 106824 / NRRL Y48691) TaxID=653667 RepID=S9X471_SCHCR|nr:mitotic spindle checkpoint protein Dma1 [Schizosaccharomyces cryophilus OY26]EPY51847.1 mitotic spindle checkpoint protein Dma1 [Schizosaccharomyces cryophilus OY26]
MTKAVEGCRKENEGLAESSSEKDECKYSIRLTNFVGPNAHSFSFDPLVRCWDKKNDSLPIYIGRYTERFNGGDVSAIVFRSKVVSRKHAQIYHENNTWYIQDMGSSSGTFLNHVRLSPPSKTSKPYAMSNNDILQLGADYRGGYEMHYRCVRARVELNNSWKIRINPYNLNEFRRVQELAVSGSTDNGPPECCICLMPVLPCQALFFAPCSHTYHYKCIRPTLVESHPYFSCFICRKYHDLEAPVEEADECLNDLLLHTTVKE